MSSQPNPETGTTSPEQTVSEGRGETRFCSSCGRTKIVLGGAMVRCANGAKRWKCADCRARSKAHMAAARGKEEGA